MRLLKAIKTLFKSQRQWDEEYLSRAVDHADLERRIRKLDRGEVHTGPFGYKENFRI